jgi:hypothetical protein
MIKYILYFNIYICTLYTHFTRTKVFPRPLLQNKAMYISLRVKVRILRAISHGLSGGSNCRFNMKYFYRLRI